MPAVFSRKPGCLNPARSGPDGWPTKSDLWQEDAVALSRSENMARIHSADTRPELIVRKVLHRAGVRYRLHVPTPGGKADVAIASKRFALFIDGCFWHGCPEHYVRPRNNPEFWARKLRENVERDRRQSHALARDGWRFIRVWEHELVEDPTRVVERIQKALSSGAQRRRSNWRVVEVTTERDGLETREHEDLFDPSKRLTTVRKRNTAKTGRVRLGRRQLSAPVAKSAAGVNQRERKSG